MLGVESAVDEPSVEEVDESSSEEAGESSPLAAKEGSGRAYSSLKRGYQEDHQS